MRGRYFLAMMPFALICDAQQDPPADHDEDQDPKPDATLRALRARLGHANKHLASHVEDSNRRSKTLSEETSLRGCSTYATRHLNLSRYSKTEVVFKGVALVYQPNVE
jgi:hypothetical protein